MVVPGLINLVVTAPHMLWQYAVTLECVTTIKVNVLVLLVSQAQLVKLEQPVKMTASKLKHLTLSFVVPLTILHIQWPRNL